MTKWCLVVACSLGLGACGPVSPEDAKEGEAVRVVHLVDARTGRCVRLEFGHKDARAYVAPPADCVARVPVGR